MQPSTTDDPVSALTEEAHLAAAAARLGAADAGDLTGPEQALLVAAGDVALDRRLVARLRAQIGDGLDPLGEAFCRLRSPDTRRPMGATYTPQAIVDAMIGWVAAEGTPDRVIDPGAGSGRFTMAAARRFPKARLVAVDVDPLAALLTRANLAVVGADRRATVVLDDFRALRLGPVDGRTAWVGNPPYVRHHDIAPEWKDWLARTAAVRGLGASKLAGLHVHFFLATAQAARAGDHGAYITAAEWLDVNYGALVRELLLDGLGGLGVHVLDPEAIPFADAAATGAISCFRLGARPRSLRLRRVRRVDDLGTLARGGRLVVRERLAQTPRWSVLLRSAQPVPDGYVELGELCRVHRGAATGANDVWITHAGDHRVPAGVLRASVTKARELFTAGEAIHSADDLRRVVVLPGDLDVLDPDERRLVDRFLRWAKSNGAHRGYLARHRPGGRWWAIGMREPAPILATYMARRPPTFVRNLAEAGHINVAHGLYPREELSPVVLDRLAEALRATVSVAAGRTYAGGLTKFEPREMERLPVPSPEALAG